MIYPLPLTVRQEISAKYFTWLHEIPHMFFGFPKEVDVLRMPGFSLDTSVGYREIRKKTAHDLCELLLLVFEDTQKRNPTATMEFVGRLLEL